MMENRSVVAGYREEVSLITKWQNKKKNVDIMGVFRILIMVLITQL